MARKLSRVSGGVYDGLLPIFGNITEKFFWGFIALDICGLWPGRFITGLLAGRRDKGYNPSTDPAMRNQPFPQQIRHWAARVWKGLNWPNCWEEMKREVVVAPGGILGVPTIGFLIGRKLQGKIIELRHGALKSLGDGFAHHLKNNLPVANQGVSREAYKKALSAYLSGMFADPLLAETVLDDTGLRAQLKGVGQAVEPTYADFLKNRFETWADHLFDPELSPQRKLSGMFSFKKSELAAKLEKLQAEIGAQLLAFNRKYRMTPYTLMGETVAAPLLHSDQAWIAPMANVKPSLTSIGGHLEDLARWSEFPVKLWNQKGVAQSGEHLAHAAEGLVRHTIARKGLVVFSFMAVATAWLVGLTRVAQSAKAYQATRNLPTNHTAQATGSMAAAPAFGGPRMAFAGTFPSRRLNPADGGHA